MDASDVAHRVRAVRELEKTDIIGAAVAADDLRIAVLQAIARGGSGAPALALAALETVD